MKKRYLSLALLVTLLSVILTYGAPVNVSGKDFDKIDLNLVYEKSNYENEFAPGHVIVVLNQSTNIMKSQSQMFSNLNIESIKVLSKATENDFKLSLKSSTNKKPGDIILLNLKSDKKDDVIKAIEVLKDDENVFLAEPDYKITVDSYETKTISASSVPNDTYYNLQYGLVNIFARFAWDIYEGNDEVIVGIVDSGIDYLHEDLVDNIWINEGEIPGDNIDNDGNGYVDDYYGWNFVDNNNNVVDNYGHGTHVAGIVGAKGNNNIGVIGVHHKGKIAALKVLDDTGGGYASSAIEATNYANMMNIPITNNSYSSSIYSAAFKLAIEQYDGLFVAAAGNRGLNTNYYESYPATYDCDNIIAVANSQQYEDLNPSSNYGTIHIDLCAPGTGIYSTLLNNSYGYASGTSMAAPYVAGAAALLKSYNEDLTADDLKFIILDTVDKISPLVGRVLSDGRLNLLKAMIKADPNNFAH